MKYYFPFLITLSLASCAILQSREDEEREQAMAYVEVGFVAKLALPVYVDDPAATCIALGVAQAREGRRILACADAYGRILGRVCTMILPRNPEPWIVAHEKLHCERGAWHR